MESIDISTWFSSLSESGFIPTVGSIEEQVWVEGKVLISFREWLHSYGFRIDTGRYPVTVGSHLFQRVASFLPSGTTTVREHFKNKFSSLSESGFIPTKPCLRA